MSDTTPPSNGGHDSYNQGGAYGPPPTTPQYGNDAPASYGEPDKRPGTVTAAGVITLISSGLTLVLLLLGLVSLGVARDAVVDQMETQPGIEGIDPDQVVTTILVVFGIFIAWCVIAMLLAVFAMRRSNVARILLVVSAAVCALFSLISITSLVSIVPLAAAVAVIVCLFAGGASQWFAGRRA